MNEDVLEQAADWYDSQGELSASETNDFLRWLQNEEHRLAYEKVAKCMESPEIEKGLLYPKGLHTKTNNVVSIFSDVKAALTHKSVYAAASVAVIGIVAFALFSTLYFTEQSHTTNSVAEATSPSNLVKTYATDIAVRRSRVLEDGSQVHLNASTLVEFESSSEKRHASLESGQVLFEVAHDAKRPFVIDVGESQVVVLGTVFDIDRYRGDMTIRVYDGQVSVRADKTITLGKGESVSVVKNRISKIQSHNDHMPPWRSGWLEIDQEPILGVITQFQR